ncbi:MAG: cyclic nucleotide-binding domain-containing protein [Pseudomonadota bacterium]
MKVADILDELDLFKDFRYCELEIVARYLRLEDVVKGAHIFREGEPGTYMLILVDGKITIYKGGEHGQHLLSHEGRGRIIGEMAMLDHERRSATCVAETDCQLLTLSEENLKNMAADHPGVAYRFMHCIACMLSRRLRRLSGLMADFIGG